MVGTQNQHPPVLAICNVTHAQVNRLPMKSTCNSLKLLTLCLQEVNSQWCDELKYCIHLMWLSVCACPIIVACTDARSVTPCIAHQLLLFGADPLHILAYELVISHSHHNMCCPLSCSLMAGHPHDHHGCSTFIYLLWRLKFLESCTSGYSWSLPVFLHDQPYQGCYHISLLIWGQGCGSSPE